MRYLPLKGPRRSCDFRVTSFCSLDLKIKGAMAIIQFLRDFVLSCKSCIDHETTEWHQPSKYSFCRLFEFWRHFCNRRLNLHGIYREPYKSPVSTVPPPIYCQRLSYVRDEFLIRHLSKNQLSPERIKNMNWRYINCKVTLKTFCMNYS